MPDTEKQLGRIAGEMFHGAATSISSWAGEIIQASSWLWKTAGCLLFVGFALCAVYSGINSVDDSLDTTGWISHSHDTPVWIAGDWMVGEYRDCGMLTTTPPAGIVLSQTARTELPRLFCGKNWDGQGVIEFQLAMPEYSAATDAVWGRSDWSTFDSYFHVLPVHYNGRIDRPDTVFDSWRCQRDSGSLTCNALN